MTTINAVAPSRLIKKPVVLDRTGLSNSGMYALIKAGKFPQQIRIGDRAIAFSESEVNAWIESRIANRNA